MNVLIACEESQEVCKAFRAKGHRAFSCDIQECSGGHPEWHIQGDVLPLLNGDCTFQTADTHTHTQAGEWDLIIAHPPCTYLTNAGAVRLLRKDTMTDPRYGTFRMVNIDRLQKGILGRDFFMAFLNARCERVAVENPTPSRIFCIPKESQVIQPYEFGHPYSKRTLLWLRGLPPLMPTEIVLEHEPWVNGGSKDAHGNYRRYSGRGERDPKNRSKTFPGIAKAMAEQWG